ncbi:hypothetical protein E5288_WYG016928 [Bos mutus]|uniref:Uncharacterized protein n=1 Tax=Bos mutus TaxID=72004 RepID=A0A6B0RYF6_9CETA|nr:hypothetical protein [Bos mutus]
MAPMGRTCERKGVRFMEPTEEELPLSFDLTLSKEQARQKGETWTYKAGLRFLSKPPKQPWSCTKVTSHEGGSWGRLFPPYLSKKLGECLATEAHALERLLQDKVDAPTVKLMDDVDDV